MKMHASVKGGAGSITEGWLLVVGIIFIAANLRAPLTSVGPLIGVIKEKLAISGTLAGMITTLPVLAFALLSPVAPMLARRFGLSRVLWFAMLLLAAGVLIRSSASISLLLAGTLILGLAISVCNVLMPSLIKDRYPQRTGLMIGVYSVSMNISGALASGVSVPLAIGLGLGWKGALGIWALLAVVALAIWLPQASIGRGRPGKTTEASQAPRVNVWKSSLAWQVALYMGTQSLLFYVMITWIPNILTTYGMSPGAAGWTLSVMQLAVLPASFGVPVLAGRMKSQVALMIVVVSFFIIGFGGLLLGGGRLVVLWTLFIGLGAGCTFSLAMMLYGLRSKTSHTAAELSGMCQAVGYLLAAIGPVLLGYLHDATGGWTIPLCILLAVSLCTMVFGIGAARNRYVEDGH
ncbi:CynX/NimT family MFS transporter [Paenibacillus puerhi]|uniref:CynX/NimT family MFS transporter n=1 Tax=Paenibacillus puerhi TaxID=2692622 RepID=UPI001359E53C|nr:MFS transporter [Paenibacillus puerhi]